MKVRFSVVAFVPPNAQLGVVGSAPFLGEWDVKRCVPLLPYSSPHPAGQEPSLWFRDVDIPSSSHGEAGAAAVDHVCANPPRLSGRAAAAGDAAGVKAPIRDECQDHGCYMTDGVRSRGDVSSGCPQCGGTSNDGWYYACTDDTRKWTHKMCVPCCNSCSESTCRSCGICERERYFSGDTRRDCADSSTCILSSRSRCTYARECTHGSNKVSVTGELNNACEGLPAEAAFRDTAEEAPCCALRHTVARTRHPAVHKNVSAHATGAAPEAANCPVYDPTGRDESTDPDTDFAWQLLLATTSRVPPRGSHAAAERALDERNGSISRTCSCCNAEYISREGRIFTPALGYREHWKHTGIRVGDQQLPILQRAQVKADTKCDTTSLYYSTSSPQCQKQPRGTMQGPLRRCCRRRDQALSSVEGTAYRGTDATIGGEMHSTGGYLRDAATAAVAGQSPSDEGFMEDAVPETTESSNCAHTCYTRIQQHRRGEFAASGRGDMSECNDSIWEAAAYSIDPRIPAVLHLLESHPLRQLHFEYKFILWYPLSEKAAMPCFPVGRVGEGAETPPSEEAFLCGNSPHEALTADRAANGILQRAGAGRTEEKRRERPSRNSGEGPGSRPAGMTQGTSKADAFCLHRQHCSSTSVSNCREWLFPPSPPRLPSPPEATEVLVWEGTGPALNRKFVFDPFDVVVDVNRSGQLQCLYICKIARFRDPRAGGTGEYELTTRFYHAVRSESRMHFSKICSGLYVGSCPRQLLHLRVLKEELKVTCIFNLQTEQDICNNYPDPMATARSAEDVSQLCDSQGLRYVWLPTMDMCDSARKSACANAAFLLLGLIKSGHCVYVHCNAGVGRSIAAISAFLCFAVGLDLRKVNFLVCAKRPVAYWDEKAMKYGLADYTYKYGRCDVFNNSSEVTLR